MSESVTDTVSSGDVPEATPVPEAKAGRQLQEARERLGLSIADVARHLKLHPRQVESLERDEYAGLPGPVFVRGFMRNYARLVGLDADSLVALAERLGGLPAAERNSVISASTSGTEMPASLRTPLEKSQGKKGWLPVTVVLILVAAGIVYYHSREVAPPPPPAPPPVAAEPATPVAPEAQAPGVPVAAESPAPPASGTPEVAVPPPVSMPAPPAAAVTPAPVQTPVESAPSAQKPAEIPIKTPPAPKPAAPASDAKPPGKPEAREAGAVSAPAPLDPSAQRSTGGPEIRLSFSRESWVEVRDSSGSVIFSQLNPAGTERVVRGQPPFQVTVGNAGGVSVRYNSREIDLGPASRTDVAHITLE